jgi:hypothetical protein
MYLGYQALHRCKGDGCPRLARASARTRVEIANGIEFVILKCDSPHRPHTARYELDELEARF